MHWTNALDLKSSVKLCYNIIRAPVAQRIRVLGFEPSGHRFEPCRVYQILFMTKQPKQIGPRELNGRELVGFIKERQAHQVRGLRQHFKVVPKLAIITTIDSPVIDLYVRLKCNYAADIAVETEVYRTTSQAVGDLLVQLNANPSVKGIIVQLPLDDPAQTDAVVNLIAPEKDVDGLGQNAKWDSATATAINWLLAGYNVNLSGKRLALVGNGRLVGAPLLKMWRNSGLDVTVYDESTTNKLATELIDYDVIVSAAGVPGLIKSEMLRSGAVVVDAGTASEGGKVVGDLDPAARQRSDLTVTPEKGGVGPLTIAALLDNVIRASY